VRNKAIGLLESVWAVLSNNICTAANMSAARLYKVAGGDLLVTSFLGGDVRDDREVLGPCEDFGLTVDGSGGRCCCLRASSFRLAASSSALLASPVCLLLLCVFAAPVAPVAVVGFPSLALLFLLAPL